MTPGVDPGGVSGFVAATDLPSITPDVARTPRGASRGALWTGGGIIASTIATFGASAYVVATSSPAAYADLAVLTVVVLIVGKLARFGADRIVVGEIHAASADGGTAAGVMRGAGIVSFSVLTGIVGGVIVFAPPVAQVISLALSSPLTSTERAMLGLWFGAEVIRFVVSEAHRARFQFGLSSMAGYGLRAPLFLGALVFLGETGGPSRRPDLILAAAGSSAIVCAATMVSVSRAFPWWRMNPVHSGRVLWIGHVSMLLTTFAATLIGSADVWILGATAPRETTASYALAISLVAGLAVAATAITGGVTPFVAAALATGDMASIQRRIVFYVRIATALVLVSYVLILFLAEPLAVHLGGGTYDGITYYVAVLGGGQVVNSAVGIAGAMLIVAGRYRLVTIVTVTVALVTVSLELVAGFQLDSPATLGAVSGAATGLLPIMGAIALHRSMGLRTDAFAR